MRVNVGCLALKLDSRAHAHPDAELADRPSPKRRRKEGSEQTVLRYADNGTDGG